MISNVLKPKRILEIGTFSGFTAQILAEGLTKNGKLYSIELDKNHYEFSDANLKESSLYSQMVLLLGDALDLIPELEEEFDLIFIDAAKRQYTRHYEAAFSKLKKGGLIIADNALWKNRVLIEKPDNMTVGVKRFNDFVCADNRVSNVLIPVGDGMHLITKK
jgi:predicted O-methyltransferase YrrM